MTAANTFDNNLNCITEVISNAEAGGWQTSVRFNAQNAVKGHNLDDVGYTETNFNNRLYRADFWRDSGKSQLPFLKFTVLPQIYSTWTSYPFMDIIHGAHVDKQYDEVVGYVPTVEVGTGGGYGYASANLTGINHDTLRAPWHSIRPAETGVGVNPWGQSANIERSDWWLAVTGTYFILIQPFHSITYFGLRSTFPWENNYDDNPPIVGFHTPTWPWQRATTTAASWETYTPKKMWAWWRLKDGENNVRAQPYMSWRSNPADTTNYVTSTITNPEWVTNDITSYRKISGDGHGSPLFRLMAADNPNLRAWRMRESSADSTDMPTYGYRYWPVIDSNTGASVPCAVPIFMRLSVNTNDPAIPSRTWWNEGGTLPGLFKSLSGSDLWMQSFYTPGETLMVNNEPYYPIVSGPDVRFRDMFLIRAR